MGDIKFKNLLIEIIENKFYFKIPLNLIKINFNIKMKFDFSIKGEFLKKDNKYLYFKVNENININIKFPKLYKIEDKYYITFLSINNIFSSYYKTNFIEKIFNIYEIIYDNKIKSYIPYLRLKKISNLNNQKDLIDISLALLKNKIIIKGKRKKKELKTILFDGTIKKR